LARLIGKSPVTLRGWERDGLVDFPRNSKGDRSLEIRDIRLVCTNPRVRERLLPDRLKLVDATLTLLELLENEDRSDRSARKREKQVSQGIS
jgi:hypothetical protein